MFSGLYSLTSLSMCWYFRSYPDGAGISSKCHVSVILLLSCSKFDWFTPNVRYFILIHGLSLRKYLLRCLELLL